MKLIVKRILAFIIDIIIFALFLFILDFLLNRNEIYVSQSVVNLLSFFLSIILAIFFLGNTIGNEVVGISYYERSREKIVLNLIIKYLILYLLIFGGSIGFSSLSLSLLEKYTIIDFPRLFPIRIEITIILISLLFFLISLGRCDFFDYLLGIKITASSYIKRPYHILVVACLFSSFFLLQGFITYKVDLKRRMSDFKTSMFYKSLPSYYPSEIFDNYIIGGAVHSYMTNTANTASFSNMETFLFNRPLNQQVLSMVVNSKTMFSKNIQKQLIEKLIHFSRISNILSNVEIEQTKFELYYFEVKSFFTIGYKYTYYYDNKAPFQEIYGGIDEGFLYNIYYKGDSCFFESVLKRISEITSIGLDSIRNAFWQDKSLNRILSNLDSSEINRLKPFSLNLQLPPLGGEIPVISFEEVKPEKWVLLNIPPSGHPDYHLIEKAFYPTNKTIYERREEMITYQFLNNRCCD